MWGWIVWSIVGLAVWVVLATCVGILLGRAVRRRDRQVPTESPPSFPAPRAPVTDSPGAERRPRP